MEFEFINSGGGGEVQSTRIRPDRPPESSFDAMEAGMQRQLAIAEPGNETRLDFSHGPLKPGYLALNLRAPDLRLKAKLWKCL